MGAKWFFLNRVENPKKHENRTFSSFFQRSHFGLKSAKMHFWGRLAVPKGVPHTNMAPNPPQREPRVPKFVKNAKKTHFGAPRALLKHLDKKLFSSYSAPFSNTLLTTFASRCHVSVATHSQNLASTYVPPAHQPSLTDLPHRTKYHPKSPCSC